MVIILKCIKSVGKLFTILVIIFAFTTFINTYSTRKIHHFPMWKINYDPFNFKNRFRPKNMKYILIWSKRDQELNSLKVKQAAFTENKCKYANCYVTDDRNLLGRDYRNFDAILINSKTVPYDSYALPNKRFIKQRYIFASKESADNYPVCNKKFENFFNITWTYKLDSDALWNYFTVYNKDGFEIGPRTDMIWPYKYNFLEAVDKKILLEKKYTAVWFVSNCYTKSRRESVFNDIQTELNNKYKLHADSVGSCGSKECGKDNDDKCLQNLKKYYFYFAFENALTEDYVTEKVLRAMLHDTVPVVFGGANYSRFLPPHSYIDARKFAAEETAAKIAYLIRNQTAYLEYFRWRQHYNIGPAHKTVCNLCEIINKSRSIKKITNPTKSFREWWNPNYKKICKHHHEKRGKRNRTASESSSCSEEKTVYRKLFRSLKIDFLNRKPVTHHKRVE